MKTSYYKIADRLRINELGVMGKPNDVKFLTKETYLKAIEELMKKGYSYIAWKGYWERVNEDDSTDIVNFIDYITE